MTGPRRTIAILGGAATLIALGSLLVLAATRDGDSADPPAGAPEPTPTAQATPTAGRTAILLPIWTPTPTIDAACGPPIIENSIIDWVPFLRVNGRTYLLEGPADVAQRGDEVASIRWNVSVPGIHPCHADLDGSSSVVGVGAPVYALAGYREDFRLLAQTESGWGFFEAKWQDGAASAEELLDVRGKVVSLTIEQARVLSDEIENTWVVTDPTRVADIVDRLLTEPITLSGSGSGEGGEPALRVTMELSDGTFVRRFWFAGATTYSTGIPVRETFLTEITASLEQSQ
jgi:hypothetical protein